MTPMTTLAARRGMTMARLIEVGPDDAAQAFREGYWNIVSGKPKGTYGRGNPKRYREGQSYGTSVTWLLGKELDK